MKQFTQTLMMALLMVSAMLFVRCGEDPIDEPVGSKPVINLKTTEVEVAAKGGDYTASYTITNPVEGVAVKATSDQKWVVVDAATAGVLKLTVEANDVEQVREAVVTVSYAKADSVQLKVVQQAGNPANLTFSVEMVEQGYYTCVIDVFPSDSKLGFLMELYTKDDYDKFGLEDDDALFENHMENLAFTGSWTGMTAQEVAKERTKFGVQYEVKLTNLKADSENVFVAYYYDPATGKRLSDVYRYFFHSKRAELHEQSFEFATEVDGPQATVTVTPDGLADGRYYFDVMPKVVVDEEIESLGVSLERYFELWWNQMVFNDMSGNSTPAYLIYENLCSAGVDSFTFDLLASTEYYVFAFEVDGDAVCVSVPEYDTFTTGVVERSDLVLTLTAENITSRGARVVIEASNDTDPYVAGVTTKDVWDSFGATERARLDGLLKTYEFTSPARGNGSWEENRDLKSETTYVFFAFGYHGGVVTTQLFYVEFTTLPNVASKESISVKHMGYFNVKDINAIDPSFGYLKLDELDYAVYPVEFECTDPSSSYYFYTWPITPYYDMDWVTDDNRLGRMVYWGERPRFLWTVVSYDTEAWICAIAKDPEGYYTEHFVNKVPITRDGVGDAQIFVDWLKNHGAAKADPSQYIDEMMEDDF